MRASSAAVTPPFLEPGERILVVAPSGVVSADRLEAGVAYLRRRGHEVAVAPHALAAHGYLAGDDASRASDLNEALNDDRARAIVFARGGYGLTRILDDLRLDALRRRPRILLGYSDATALFLSLQRRGPYLTHYGPMASELGDPDLFDEQSLWGTLYGVRAAFRIPFAAGDVLRAGRGTGRVIGGCLSLLVTLLGTRHDPDYRDAILFWEEVAEPPYRIDRMLTQLRNAGKLDRLRGMIIGSTADCVPAPGRPSLDLDQVVHELAGEARFPIVRNVRAGHIGGKLTLPLGLPATLDTRARALTFSVPAGAARRRAASVSR